MIRWEKGSRPRQPSKDRRYASEKGEMFRRYQLLGIDFLLLRLISLQIRVCETKVQS